jgi:formate dehydrogenase subunit beta
LVDAASLAAYFAACQRCHNCMVACPICYCKECLFRTAAFDHEQGRYLRWAGRKGATRLPADTVLFHLTRLNHMSTSCVGCGLCESACPSNIPLTVLLRTVSSQTQALFDYVPGRRLDEEIPLMSFREAELETKV